MTISGWKQWGLPAFAALLSPWQDRLTQVKLISDWFQPSAQIVATLLGPITCMFAFAILSRGSSKRALNASFVSLAIWLFAMAICLALGNLVGVYWVPSEHGTFIVWGVWAVSYVLTFSAFGFLIMALFLAASLGRPRQKKS